MRTSDPTPSEAKAQTRRLEEATPAEASFLAAVGARPLMDTYSLHCSSFFWFNQFYIKDPKR